MLKDLITFLNKLVGPPEIKHKLHMAENRPSIALVIGSGGIKPFGMIKFFTLLDTYKLEPDTIIGCSGGAIAGGCWAAGYSISECQHWIDEYIKFAATQKVIRSFNFKSLMSLLHLPGVTFKKKNTILKSDQIFQLLKDMYGDLQIENLPRKLMISTTDLDTGKQVLLDHGPLAEAVYASMALYPLLPPIWHQGKWLVDGAYSSSTPALSAVNLGFDKIIVCSYSEPNESKDASFAEFFHEFLARTLRNHSYSQNQVAQHLHHRDIMFIDFDYDRTIQLNDYNAIGLINEVAAQVVEKNKEKILSMFKDL